MTDDKNILTLQKYTLLSAIISSFITPFLASAINISLPAIGEEFHMDSILLGWVATSFLLASVIFLLPMGRIADIYGRKKVYLSGSIILVLGTILAIFSNSSFTFILSRIVQGIGCSMIFGTNTAILTSVYPPQNRGKALGLVIASVYLGGSLGPVIGGLLVHQFGWRSIYIFTLLVISFIPFIIKFKIKHEWADAKGEPYDFLGTSLFVGFIFSLIYGLTILPSYSALSLITGGLILLVLFIVFENKKKYPLFDVKLFYNNSVFAMSNLAALINYSATFGVGFLLSLYLQYIKGFSAQTAGLIMFSQPIIMSITSPYAGKLSDRIEPRILASIGMALTFLGLLMLAFLTDSSSIPYIILCLLTLGLGFGLFSSPNANAIMTSVEKKYLGVASSAMGSMRHIGQMLSMGIIMTIFTLYLGRVKITPENYDLFLKSMKIAFIISAVLCGLGIFASLKRGNLRS